MFKSRKEFLKDWNRLLDDAHSLLQIAKRRNEVLACCSKKEKEYEDLKSQYEKILFQLSEFLEGNEEFKEDLNSQRFVKLLEEKLAQLDYTFKETREQSKEVAALTNEIEEYVIYISKFSSVFKDFNLSKSETNENKVSEIFTVLLAFNLEDHMFSEENLFASPYHFYGLLEESDCATFADSIKKLPVSNLTDIHEIYGFLDEI